MNFTVTYITNLHLFIYFCVSDLKYRCVEYQNYGRSVCDNGRSG